MESLRDKLLSVIVDSLPETPEITKFIEGGDFGDILDKVMDTIAEHLTECLSDKLS